MVLIQRLFVVFFILAVGHMSPAQDGRDRPLRIYIRAGVKTHGPGQHDHPRFLEEWTELLKARGAETAGSLHFPSPDELSRTDVLVMYAADAGSIVGEQRTSFEAFLKRGGGLVVIHDAVCGADPEWFKTRVGGAWEHGHSKWLEGKVGLYFGEPHAITRGIPHFDLDDEVYYDLHMAPEAQVLASGFHDIFSVSPQMWVVDQPEQRVFVTLQGHQYSSFRHPAFRTLLLRGIAWAGRRDVDLLTAEDELAQLRYPPGGPLDPELAAEPFELHEDFEINLVASEPLIVNPISIDWDLKGRLWVAQTPGYPYKEEFKGIPAHDQITILEDTDGDGRLDRSRVFADGLDLVTSFVFHGNGVIVTQAPEILWLRDHDGDDVADERLVLYTGFGYGDTHAVTSNLRWGIDGWIYGTQGYSGNGSRSIRSPYHDERNRGTSSEYGHIPNGVFRFRPDGSAIEPYSVYGSNTWGLDFSPGGELFFSMANGSHLRHVLLSEHELGANRLPGVRTWRDIVDHRKVFRISKADRAPYVQIDFVGGFTAVSGSMIYSGGVWPEEYTGNHFVCEPTVNLVHRDVLTPAGATYTASKPRQKEFLASSDPWFRPVQTRLGPKGAMYVLDFYSQAAIHNDPRGPKHGPTNAARRPDRDRHHGRIWRVQHKQALATPPVGTHFWNAMRILRGLRDGLVPASEAPAIDASSPAVRVRALWASFHGGTMDVVGLQRGMGDKHPDVRRAAARIAAVFPTVRTSPALGYTLALRINDPDERVQLAVLTALPNYDLQPHVIDSLVPYYLQLENDWARSAFVHLAQERLAEFLPAAIGVQQFSSEPAELAAAEDLVTRLVAIVGRRGEPQDVTQALEWLLEGGEGLAHGLPGVLQSLQGSLRPEFQFAAQNDRAGTALAGLFVVHRTSVRVQSALLPLAARIEESAALEAAIKSLAAGLEAMALDPEGEIDARLMALFSLLELPSRRASAIEVADRFLDPYFAPEVQDRVIDALAGTGKLPAAQVLVNAFPRVSNQARERIFQELIVRPAWSGLLLDQLESQEIQVAELGPRRLFRLREHASPAIAARAKLVIDAQSAPAPAMEELLISFLPVIRQAGDVQHGQELFIENCAVCHRHESLPEGLGADVGPSLVGMGAHGAEHLLPFIMDPNLSVEAAYLEYVAETLDGQLIAGVLTYDGPDSITISNSGGNESIRRDEIESLRSTGRSPMPTGFELLGAESLRDMLAFICQGYEDYRIVSLKNLVNASTSKGLYDRQHDAHAMRFEGFGVLDVSGVPMQVFDPAGMPDASNAIVLKGGAQPNWQSKTDMPQRVEIPLGFKLQRMHVLGGISAWGHPFFGEMDSAVQWTFHYADGTSETHLLKDGVEFADWIRRHDVPGSDYVEGILAPGSVGQLRTFSVDPMKPDVTVERLTLESFDNRTAPTFLALTAQVHGAEPRQAKAPPAITHPELLIVGGGSSHDFARWFDRELRATIQAGGLLDPSKVEYTSQMTDVLPRLGTLEVLVLSNNQAVRGEELRKGVFDHVRGGGGLLLVHASTWYSWLDWPEFNRELVGGGSRGHEAYGEFDVLLEGSEHPVLAGIPERFTISDELYRFEPAPDGAAIQVLASGVSKVSGDSFPVLWITQTEGGRVLCTTLGHDGAAHTHPAFQRLIQNAARWLAQDF